jgi:hypothetical protein
MFVLIQLGNFANGSTYIVLRPFGTWALCTNVSSKLFVTLGFIFALHFIKGIANGDTRRVEPPITPGATEALKIWAINPL